MLQNKNNFAILIYDKDYNEDLIHIIQKMSVKRHIGFNRCNFDGDTEYSYVLYDMDKTSLFAVARNKKLKLIWKDNTDFYIIDFSNNMKGDIICYLSDKDVGAGILEGNVVVPNLKPQFQNMKKVQLVSSKQLDEETHQKYEHFVFYIKK